MHGTLVCAITDGAENDDAVAQALAVSERLGLRLVLAHVVDGIPALGNGEDETITMKGDRVAAERRLRDLAQDHDLASAERRIAVGDPATLLGRIATEEAADVIVVGSRKRRWGRGSLENGLAQKLEAATPVPVLIAPAGRRRPGKRHGANGAQRR
jgi:nucleotide-binding universal stress UspA family protein